MPYCCIAKVFDSISYRVRLVLKQKGDLTRKVKDAACESNITIFVLNEAGPLTPFWREKKLAVFLAQYCRDVMTN